MAPRPGSSTAPAGPRSLAIVALGGALGTAARYLLTVLFPTPALPVVTLLINVAGAFLLGLLVELVGRMAATRPAAADGLRLLLGTGLLGGFTTYSALTLDTVTAGSAAASVLYGLGTLVLGLGAAAGGIALARRRA